jgi:hypothetical protein
VDGQAGSRAIEILVEDYRVRGELVATGGPRRLVDILNAAEDIVSVRDATLDYPLSEAAEAQRVPVAHIHLNTILFAIPHGSDVLFEDPFEKVDKVPVECTIVVPGFQISANIHMLRDADPGESHLLTTLHFVALTEARVFSLARPSTSWQADVIVANLKRSVVYAPTVRATAPVL